MFAAILGLLLGSALLGAALVWLLKDALEPLLAARRAAPLWIAGAIFAAAALKALADFAQAALMNRLGLRFVADLQKALFAQFIRADLAALGAGHSGGRLSPFFTDAQILREAAANAFILLLRNGAQAIAFLAAMAAMDPWLALVLAPIGLAASGVMRGFFRRGATAARSQLQQAETLSAAMLDRFDGVKAVKLAGAEAREIARVGALIDGRQRALVRGADARAAAAPFTDFIAGLAIAVLVVLMAWRAQAGGFDAARFLAFIYAAIQASQALRQCVAQFGALAEGQAAAARIVDLFAAAPATPETPGAPPLNVGAGRVSLASVRFAYPGRAPVLEDFSVEFAPGRITALVGASGAGKSTILNLIPRFYAPDAGAVMIDGQDVAAVGLASLRSRIALVTQAPILFDDSVAANIAYERPDAGEDAVRAAAAAAGALDFIQALPDRFATRVGEGGALLSGGQMQRLALARAFLKDAPILLLDEPSAALDAHAAAELRATLLKLMAGRTVILIAHDLAMAIDADEAIVLDHGAIVERGPPAVLLATGGAFARLAAAGGRTKP